MIKIWRFLPVLSCLLVPAVMLGQPAHYTAAHAHSHNDYEQAQPFSLAYSKQFGSVEADLFLRNDSLFVAHHARDIRGDRTFEALYLSPMLHAVKANRGRGIYGSEGRELQLLIDLKTEAYSTLKALVHLLEPHTRILYPAGDIRIVISGNTPRPADFVKYPPYVFFDGRPEMQYTPAELTRVGLISQSFTRYSFWKGESPFPDEDVKALSAVVRSAHDKGKKFRFWATPDTVPAWTLLRELGVDYINTDRIEALAAFLGNH